MGEVCVVTMSRLSLGLVLNRHSFFFLSAKESWEGGRKVAFFLSFLTLMILSISSKKRRSDWVRVWLSLELYADLTPQFTNVFLPFTFLKMRTKSRISQRIFAFFF